jgi:hypothetical protein
VRHRCCRTSPRTAFGSVPHAVTASEVTARSEVTASALDIALPKPSECNHVGMGACATLGYLALGSGGRWANATSVASTAGVS